MGLVCGRAGVQQGQKWGSCSQITLVEQTLMGTSYAPGLDLSHAEPPWRGPSLGWREGAGWVVDSSGPQYVGVLDSDKA